jgi:hypothetical protein
MDGLKGIAKGGWHPKGKGEGGKDSVTGLGIRNTAVRSLFRVFRQATNSRFRQDGWAKAKTQTQQP